MAARKRPPKRQCSKPNRKGGPCGAPVVQGTDPPLCFRHGGRRRNQTSRPRLNRVRRNLGERKLNFVRRLAETGNVTEAAKAAEVARSTPFQWRNEDSDFAVAWDEAQESAADAVELEARRRAVDGYEEPVFYQGEVCGHVRRFSDRLIDTTLRLNGRLSDRVSHEHTGAGGGPIRIEDARDALDAKLDRLAAAGAAEALLEEPDGD